MPKLRIQSFSISLDGYGAGPEQSLKNPQGIGFMAMQEWAFATKTFREMMKMPPGGTGVDDELIKEGFKNIGAWIIGRNMFGPVRGPWQDLSWKGWWGDNPPYHCPVFVLTHHPRKPLSMDGGTVFYFVTDGIEGALKRAKEAAGGKDVRVGGGVSTIRQYLQAGLVDEAHFAMSPVLQGAGEHVFTGLNLKALGYECTRRVASLSVTHFVLTKRQ